MVNTISAITASGLIIVCILFTIPLAGQYTSAAVNNRILLGESFLITPLSNNTTKKFTPVVQQKPFFCRWEDRIENRSGVALRFRLGGLDYVNALENKK